MLRPLALLIWIASVASESTLPSHHLAPINRPRMASQQQAKLLHKLFDQQAYNAYILPTRGLNDTIQVKFKVYLIQLIHVEEKSQIMKTNVWLQMEWTDYQLAWDKTEYRGLNAISVRPDKPWKPDIVLLNNADGNYDFMWEPNLLLFENGGVMWMPPAVYQSSCTIEVEYFPFDEQECQMKFGSLTFSANQVSFYFAKNQSFLDLSSYWKSGTWDLVNVSGRILHEKRGSRETLQIVYTIRMRRKTLFYTVILILPCIMISMLSICVFYLPADAGEKMTLCISILFALVVFLLLVSKILPPTSTSIPLISRYLLFTFIINIYAILVTVLIINWNYRTTRTHAMPKWVRRLFMEFMPVILGMHRPVHVEQEIRIRSYLKNLSNQAQNPSTCSESLARAKVDSKAGNIAASRAEAVQLETFQAPSMLLSNRHRHSISSAASSFNSLASTSNDEYCAICNQHCTSSDTDTLCRPPATPAAAEETTTNDDDDEEGEEEEEDVNCGARTHAVWGSKMKSCTTAINYISAKLHDKCEFELVLGDWKYVAAVIDRLMLVVFVTVTTVGTISIFMQAPYIFEAIDQDEFIRVHQSGQ